MLVLRGERERFLKSIEWWWRELLFDDEKEEKMEEMVVFIYLLVPSGSMAEMALEIGLGR